LWTKDRSFLWVSLPTRLLRSKKKYAADEHKIFLHAEIAAIKKALRFYSVDMLRGTTLIVCRVKKNGLGNSKPCIGCQRAIAEFGIKKVIYTTEDGWETL